MQAMLATVFHDAHESRVDSAPKPSADPGEAAMLLAVGETCCGMMVNF